MPALSREVVQLPNIRKMFIPDPGMVMYDADLSGADAQVVAWEAEDEDLKAAFRAGLKVHAKNAEDLFGDEWRRATGDQKVRGTPKGQLYYACKQGVHATNYGASARTLAIVLGWTVARATEFQDRWFGLHPGIRAWHRRTEHQLHLPTHCVWNPFGYRRTYFDRVDGVLPEALAWVPQSTVAEVCFRGAIQLVRRYNWVQMLLQVHDSILFQIPEEFAQDPETDVKILEVLSVPVPYPDPLIIPWKITKSRTSWGDCQ